MMKKPIWMLEKEAPFCLVIYSDYSLRNNLIAWGFVLAHRYKAAEDMIIERQHGVFDESYQKGFDFNNPHLSNIFEQKAGAKAYEYINKHLRVNTYECILHIADHPHAYSDENIGILNPRSFPEVQCKWVHSGNLAHAECRKANRLVASS